MSDIILGAIIGIVGALIGAGITGYVQYHSAKLQIDARSTEQKQQLEHQERESRKSRLVESRKEYLVRLRETVSKWATELTHMIDQTRSMSEALKTSLEGGYIGRSYKSQREVFVAIGAQMEALKRELEVLQGQVSDEKLNDAIDTVLSKEVEVRLINLVNMFSEWLTDKAEHITSLDEALDKTRMASFELREHLLQVNKRIEELLVGDEA